MKKGISIETIAAETKVAVDLLTALERNDFSRWPSGIYARAYVRQYAMAVGVDPDSTVDEFCRLFPQGDRRAERIVREQAGIVGHELTWRDDEPAAAERDRRGGPGPRLVAPARPPNQSPLTTIFMRLRRTFGKA